MAGNTYFAEFYDAAGFFDLIPDPGTGGEIAANRDRGMVEIKTAAAETRTVATPTKGNLILTLAMKVDTGDCTITFDAAYTEAGTTELVLTDAGMSVTLISVPVSATAFQWRVLSVQGLAALTAADGGTVDATYGQDEADVIANNVTRIGEIESRLQAAGIIR